MASIIFKPTEACNARCQYCDSTHKASQSVGSMSYETLELLFSRMNEFLVGRPEESIDLIWHGGEPLLLGTEYFLRALEFQEKHCSATAPRICHSIQTNLTLMTRDFARVFKKLGMDGVGTSYDPIAGVRGLGTHCDSSEYNRRFLDGVASIEEEGMSWGFIYIVTRLSLANPQELFRTLLNLSPKGAFMFNPVLLYGQGKEHLRVTAEQYRDFLGAIFPLWWERRAEIPNVEPFASLVRNLVDNQVSLYCGDSGACAYSHINVAPDGSLSHCGRSADWGLLNYGSISDKTLAEVLADPQRERLLQRNSVLPETECKGCRFWKVCHGGCPLDAWSAAGSFLHKSEWCRAKKGFIERYFEPIVNSLSKVCADSGPDRTAERLSPTSTLNVLPTQEAPKTQNGELPWVNPVGGLGDTLMLAGVLKHVCELQPTRRFNLVERTKYWPLLEGHPAIARVGSPPPGAEFVQTAYWEHEDFRAGKRAYQVLATMFGLQTPVDESLFIAWEPKDDPILMKAIPWKRRNVLICQSSDSPRKQISVAKWEALVAKLNSRQEIAVVQDGRASDCYIRGCYSLLGLTTPRQLIALVRHFDAVISSDTFIMHAAHLAGVPAIVLWGPTKHGVYGYAEQKHLQANPMCEHSGGCIGPEGSEIYHRECPRGDAHCVDTISVDEIYAAVMTMLSRMN